MPDILNQQKIRDDIASYESMKSMLARDVLHSKNIGLRDSDAISLPKANWAQLKPFWTNVFKLLNSERMNVSMSASLGDFSAHWIRTRSFVSTPFKVIQSNGSDRFDRVVGHVVIPAIQSLRFISPLSMFLLEGKFGGSSPKSVRTATETRNVNTDFVEFPIEKAVWSALLSLEGSFDVGIAKHSWKNFLLGSNQSYNGLVRIDTFAKFLALCFGKILSSNGTPDCPDFSPTLSTVTVAMHGPSSWSLDPEKPGMTIRFVAEGVAPHGILEHSGKNLHSGNSFLDSFYDGLHAVS